jgi:hypothetical protein
MSVIRPKLPEDPIRYDPAAAFAAGTVSRPAVEGLAGRLDAARAEAVASAVVDQPDRLLTDYGTKRPESELFAILRSARRIRDAVDRGVARVEEALTSALDRAGDAGHQFASPRRDLARALLQNFLGVLMLARCGHGNLEPSVSVMLDALLGPQSHVAMK